MFSVVRRRPLIILLLAALLLRVLAAFALQFHLDRQPEREFLIAGDAAGYWELGSRIAHREAYELYDPPRQVLRMPGFPITLAVSMLIFGDSKLAARLWLAVVGTFGCGMVYALGRELFDHLTGLWACLFTAISPTLIGFSVLILSETAFASCLVLSLYCLAKLVRTPLTKERKWSGMRWSAAAGAALVLACFMRPSWLPAALLFAVLYLFLADNRLQAALRMALFFATIGLCFAPWIVRNHRLTGHPIVTTLWVGPSLYDGLNPDATGDSDMTFYERDRLPEQMTEYEIDRHYRDEAIQFARENPARVVQLAWLKFLRFWKPWPNAEQFDHPILKVSVAAFFLPLVILAARGFWVHRRRIWVWGLTAGPILLFTAIHMVFVGSLRYRLPAEYPLWVLAAAGLMSWIRSRSQQNSHSSVLTSA